MTKDISKQIAALGEKENEVLQILKSFEQEENDYLTCMELEAALESVGYTIEWGLDAEPFNLKKIKLTN